MTWACSAGKSGRSAARASSAEHAGARRLRIERAGQAEPQNLRQIVEQPHRRAQHCGIFAQRARRAGPPFPATRAVEVSRMSGIAAACTSCRYWAMNSISTSAPAAYLRSQGSASPFSVAIAARISMTSSATARASRLRQSTSRIAASTRAANSGDPRHDARAGQRHVLPGPCLAFLVTDEAVDLRRQRAGAAGRPQAACRPVEHAVVGLHRQRADQALGEPRKILRAVERTLAVGIRMLGVEIVDDDEVEIGTRRHLPRAEPAERHDRGLAGRARGHAAAKSASAARVHGARISTSARRAKTSPACSAETEPDRMRAPIRNMCSWPNRRIASSTSS